MQLKDTIESKRKETKEMPKIIIILLLIALALFFGICIFFFNFSVCRKRWYKNKKIGEKPIVSDEQAKKMLECIEWLELQKIENVRYYGRKSIFLTGQLIENHTSNKFVVLVHGYRSASIHNFANIIKKYYDMGFSILMPTQRAHGNSDGNFITFGYEEAVDMYFWSRYLSNRFGQNINIILHGISMGASTVLLLNELHIPWNIKGIVADCGYSSVISIFKHIMKKDFGIPNIFATPIIKTTSLISEFVADFPFDECNPIEAVKNATVPILFVHGTSDKFVPYEMSIEMYNACSSKIKELVLIEGAGHGMSHLTDTTTYEEHLDAFLSKII